MTTAIARVLVGIDGSEQALAAVRAAVGEATRRKVPLHIVHAFIWSSLHVNVGPVAPDLPATGLRHQAEDLLVEAAAEARKTAPQIPVSTHLIDGAATPALLEESDPATLLVLGDRGLGGFSGLIIGSVAVHAAAHARCPILVVRGAEPAAGPVVVGVDGSEQSRLAIGFAFEESAQRGAELIGLHVWEGSPGRSRDLVAQGAGQTLTKALSGWQQKYPAVVVKPELVRGDPRHELVERSRNAQLMVLGASGRDTFKGLLLGSVSQNLLYHSHCPIAVIRATLSSPAASGPSDNVDRFLDRPVNAVAGLVPGRQRADEVLDALRADAADPSDVVVLHGQEGVRILDTNGTEHGWHAKLVRFFQKWGYDDAVLNLYDEGLRKGESVFVIPSTPEDKIALARLLQRHQGHAIHYFGLRTAESLSGP
jgi:nucleotide-binding universal stress UspA family protein